MTNIIGPIEHDDWVTLRMLNEDLRWMKANNADGRWNDAIARETGKFKTYRKDIPGIAA